MDWVRREAQRIEEKAQQRGKFAELEYYPWVQGLNHLRLMPPTKGNPPFLSKIIYQHFGILLDKPKSPVTCYELSYPESQFRCPACIVLHELQNLQVDTGRFRPRGKAKTNCVDRRHPEWEVMIAELPMKVYNWVISQMATQMIDVTDPHQGIDILVTMSGEGLDRDYVTSFPATGRTPLSTDPHNSRSGWTRSTNWTRSTSRRTGILKKARRKLSGLRLRLKDSRIPGSVELW